MANIKNHRKQLYATYGHRYSRFGTDWSSCWYCGAPREHLDHVPPLAWVESIDAKKAKKNGVRFLLVASCARCNLILGDKPLFTLGERLAYLADKYAHKVGKRPLWTEDELEDMSPRFKSMIRAGSAKTAALISALRGVEDRLLSLSEDEAE